MDYLLLGNAKIGNPTMWLTAGSTALYAVLISLSVLIAILMTRNLRELRFALLVAALLMLILKSNRKDDEMIVRIGRSAKLRFQLKRPQR
jgi:hypothetical protein